MIGRQQARLLAGRHASMQEKCRACFWDAMRLCHACSRHAKAAETTQMVGAGYVVLQFCFCSFFSRPPSWQNASLLPPPKPHAAARKQRVVNRQPGMRRHACPPFLPLPSFLFLPASRPSPPRSRPCRRHFHIIERCHVASHVKMDREGFFTNLPMLHDVIKYNMV